MNLAECENSYHQKKHFIKNFYITLHYVRTQKSAYDSLPAGKQSSLLCQHVDVFYDVIWGGYFRS